MKIKTLVSVLLLGTTVLVAASATRPAKAQGRGSGLQELAACQRLGLSIVFGVGHVTRLAVAALSLSILLSSIRELARPAPFGIFNSILRPSTHVDLLGKHHLSWFRLG